MYRTIYNNLKIFRHFKQLF